MFHYKLAKDWTTTDFRQLWLLVDQKPRSIYQSLTSVVTRQLPLRMRNLQGLFIILKEKSLLLPAPFSQNEIVDLDIVNFGQVTVIGTCLALTVIVCILEIFLVRVLHETHLGAWQLFVISFARWHWKANGDALQITIYILLSFQKVCRIRKFFFFILLSKRDVT